MAYADNFFLPFALLEANTFLPPAVLILLLKPCTLALCLFFGWNVIFIAKNNAVAFVEKLFVNTAANLKYGGYGEAGEFKPSSTKTPVIYLDGAVKNFRAIL